MTSTQADPLTVLKIHKADHPPGLALVYLCPRSLAARLAADAEGSGDEVTDLGPGALIYTQAAKRDEFGKGTMVLVGIAQGSRWQLWTPPAPVEPVPGTPGHTASRN